MPEASIISLPPELFDNVRSHLARHDLTVLARTCKAMNKIVQHSLYYHAEVEGFDKLHRFHRTLMMCQNDKTGLLIRKNVQHLKLILDPQKENRETSERSTAAVLAREISIQCPGIQIQLLLKNATCSRQPISSFAEQEFRRVTSLILETGPPAPGTLPRSPHVPPPMILNSSIARQMRQNPPQEHGCYPSREFWSAIFNGYSFPDLKEFDLQHMHCIGIGKPPVTFEPPDLTILGSLEKLVVTAAPELDSSVLLGALPYATKLKHLELRNLASIYYEHLAALLPIALPNLNWLTLHISPNNHSAEREFKKLRNIDPLISVHPEIELVHLCEIFREHGKNTPHLDLYLPYACREIFLSVHERIKVAGYISETGDHLDRLSTTKAIQQHRKMLQEECFKEAVRKNVKAAQKEGKTKDNLVAEYEEQQKLLQRQRKIKQERWSRVLRIENHICRSCRKRATWEEMGLLAGLEEEGVTWSLGYELKNLGGIYSAGKEGVESSYDQLFPECSRRRRLL
ncbi:Similar to hypothetical protein AOL_s00083g50 [Arthrobotrys oligospora ATCC 24927]; acc. no. EGX47838 [Pyronema omphalodes CBS 100304]|uniref:F-box domain-containing protein n=1 Tax=Pyronema omphalodes (strain CBS 100304) TaxID=1076935 RepID=U4LRI3_PYROM|nr:Similar to hypothetical protein AOL_s00083g50 [Arthrobotrys oligospora ATCC 24927]; acc. no. EGX47838 [Pyronema omphalodes CBS 100304]